MSLAQSCHYYLLGMITSSQAILNTMQFGVKSNMLQMLKSLNCGYALFYKAELLVQIMQLRLIESKIQVTANNWLGPWDKNRHTCNSEKYLLCESQKLPFVIENPMLLAQLHCGAFCVDIGVVRCWVWWDWRFRKHEKNKTVSFGSGSLYYLASCKHLIWNNTKWNYSCHPWNSPFFSFTLTSIYFEGKMS